MGFHGSEGQCIPKAGNRFFTSAAALTLTVTSIPETLLKIWLKVRTA